MNYLLPNVNEVIQASQQIQLAAKQKSKEEINPLLVRIQYIVEELQAHLLAISESPLSLKDSKFHWSVLYRDGDTLDEMYTMLKHTTPLPVQTEVEYIKKCLIFYTRSVVDLFGENNSLYIITPKFQELSNLW
ncbi:hypothetical protein ACN6MT_16205 [Neobacillus niacini]|uniref:hypothetical protein n=1 Tax=Neobacillus niacini TaxID=86668 RepID=UPI003B0104CB